MKITRSGYNPQNKITRRERKTAWKILINEIVFSLEDSFDLVFREIQNWTLAEIRYFFQMFIAADLRLVTFSNNTFCKFSLFSQLASINGPHAMRSITSFIVEFTRQDKKFYQVALDVGCVDAIRSEPEDIMTITPLSMDIF